MSDKELFNLLLADLEKFLETQASEAPHVHPLPASFFAAIKKETAESNQLRLARQYLFCKAPDVLKVMNSGIFYNGELKWRKVRGKHDYKTLPIKDLAYFILEVASRLASEGWDKMWDKIIRDFIVSAFDVAIKQIAELENIVRRFRDQKINLRKLENTRRDLQEIKSDLESKPTPAAPRDIKADLKKTPSRIILLANLLQEQVPGVNPNTTGRAIKLLLAQFGAPGVEVHAILQEMRRLA